MKKQICDYFRTHPKATSHECARELGLDERKLLKALNELCADQYLSFDIVPLGVGRDPNSSMYYYVIKEYKEQ